jgi:hypothetical protein
MSEEIKELLEQPADCRLLTVLSFGYTSVWVSGPKDRFGEEESPSTWRGSPRGALRSAS